MSSAGVITFSFMEGSNIICSSQVSIANLVKCRGTNQWHNTRFEGKNSGQFNLRVEFDGATDDGAGENEEEKKEEAPVVEPAQPLPPAQPTPSYPPQQPQGYAPQQPPAYQPQQPAYPT
jgi:hypothetical protein